MVRDRRSIYLVVSKQLGPPFQDLQAVAVPRQNAVKVHARRGLQNVGHHAGNLNLHRVQNRQVATIPLAYERRRLGLPLPLERLNIPADGVEVLADPLADLGIRLSGKIPPRHLHAPGANAILRASKLRAFCCGRLIFHRVDDTPMRPICRYPSPDQVGRGIERWMWS